MPRITVAHALNADLLLGDFNAISNLTEYSIIRTLFNDSWMTVYPSGINGTSYNGSTAEDYRIDYIFYTNIICTACEVITESTASDHKPVVAIFSIYFFFLFFIIQTSKLFNSRLSI